MINEPPFAKPVLLRREGRIMTMVGMTGLATPVAGRMAQKGGWS